MNITLNNRRALVCGASAGIGKAIAESFAKAGAQVILLARGNEALEKVLNGLEGSGHSVVSCDIQDLDQLSKVLTELNETDGAFDIVVNNSGGPPAGKLSEAMAEDFEKAMTRLLLSSHTIVKHCLPAMKTNGFGRIINIISTSVRQPIDNLGVSNTIRAATASWAKTLSREVAPFGITVNNILPGATATDRLEDIIQRTMQRTSKSRADVEAELLAEIPAGRFAKPEEIASAATFLASDQAAYVSGINLSVDGGRTRSFL